jgi:primosomal protein N' (replication factor Y) (superfamily II helicase)
MIVGVHPLAGFDKILHYKVPDRLVASVGIGSLVRIQIGRRFTLGIVGVAGAPDDFPVDRLKQLTEVIYDFEALPADLLALAKWMAVYYAAPLDGIIETMLPTAVRRAAGLKQEKLLTVCEKLTPEDLVALHKRAPQQAKLYDFLVQQFKPVAKGLVLQRLGVGASSATGLIKRGVVQELEQRVKRVAYDDDFAAGELVAALPHLLNAEQQSAFDALKGVIDKKEFGEDRGLLAGDS